MAKRGNMANSGPDSAVISFFSELCPDVNDFAGSGILAAVSGGSDSVAMLCLLHDLAPRLGFTLSAMTVNHLVRCREESSADARFVADLCARFDPPVPCTVVDLGEGEVAALSESRGRGIEDAARHLRYRHFAEVAAKTGARFVCTGHTRDDQLETVLMRFLQGAGSSSLGGIARRRGMFIRPVLECTREDLRAVLRDRGIGWREDSTNTDETYVRNRIRHTLVPLLAREFPGWDSGVLSAAAHARSDERFCRSRMEEPWSKASWTRTSRGVFCDAAEFALLDPALRQRFLRDGLSLLSPDHRVSSGFLDRLAHAPEDWASDTEAVVRGPLISGSGFIFRKEGKTLFWEADIVQNPKSRYLVSIASPGTYRLPSRVVAVTERDGNVFLDGRLGPFGFPLILRSRSGGDTVRMADGKQKTLKKLMNDWAVQSCDRDSIPVVEQDGEIRAVYGGLFGYPDWYIHP